LPAWSNGEVQRQEREEKKAIVMKTNEIRAFIVDNFLFGEEGKLTDSAPLLENHIIDSTGVLEIVSFLEERFGIRIEDDELVPENLGSIEKISFFLDKKMGAMD
jgi:acyl carrier protein